MDIAKELKQFEDGKEFEVIMTDF